MKFIHVTDPHLPDPGQMLWGLDAYGRFERCLDDIARWHADAAFCLLTGDLTDRGTKDAYLWLRERLRNFPIATHLLIGNHDDRDTFRNVFSNAPADENGFVQSVVHTDAGIFLCLDTFKGKTSAGQYCVARQGWLRDRLIEFADRPVWIAMHHPPMDIGIAYMDRIKLDEAEEFKDLLLGHGNIRHIFFGHVHRAVQVTWHGITCSALPGINHQVPLVRASVGTNYSVEPPMYGVVLTGPEGTIIHSDAYMDRAGADM